MTSDVASFTNLIGTFYEFVPEGEEEDEKVEEKAPNLATILEAAKPQDENTSDSGVEAKSTESSEVANALGRYVEDSGAEEDDLEAERERLVSELASLQKDMMEIQVAIQLTKFCARVSAPVFARDPFLKRPPVCTGIFNTFL